MGSVVPPKSVISDSAGLTTGGATGVFTGSGSLSLVECFLCFLSPLVSFSLCSLCLCFSLRSSRFLSLSLSSPVDL